MAITLQAPRNIHLGGPKVEVDDLVASAAITPGMLIEMHDDSGVNKWRANASATEFQATIIALARPELNDGIDVDYAIGDLVPAAFLSPGSKFWGIIPSGQNISNAELLKSAANGKFQSAGTTTEAAGLGKFQSLDNPGAVVADTRIRIQVIA